MQCEEIYTSEDPMGNFAKALLNYHEHYQDIHSSTWCRFHPKVRKKLCSLLNICNMLFKDWVVIKLKECFPGNEVFPEKDTKSTERKYQ